MDHDVREVFKRYEGNPILTARQWPNIVNAVFNPGATSFEGETLLLVRVEDRTGMSRLTVVRSFWSSSTPNALVATADGSISVSVVRSIVMTSKLPKNNSR